MSFKKSETLSKTQKVDSDCFSNKVTTEKQPHINGGSGEDGEKKGKCSGDDEMADNFLYDKEDKCKQKPRNENSSVEQNGVHKEGKPQYNVNTTNGCSSPPVSPIVVKQEKDEPETLTFASDTKVTIDGTNSK